MVLTAPAAEVSTLSGTSGNTFTQATNDSHVIVVDSPSTTEFQLIHPSSVIAADVTIGKNCKIGPFVIIEAGVEIGDNCEIDAHTVIKAGSIIGASNKIGDHCHIGPRTRVGNGNDIGPRCLIGLDPQHRVDKGLNSRVEIGDNNRFTGSVTIERGTDHFGGVTKIGDSNFLMVGVHLAHDVKLGDSNNLINNVTVGGHVQIGNGTNISAKSSIHQFVRIGDLAMIAYDSVVMKDIPPFCRSKDTDGIHLLRGLNKVALQRNGFSSAQISELRKAYRAAFWDRISTTEIALQFSDSILVTRLLGFIVAPSKREITNAHRGVQSRRDSSLTIDDT